MAYQLNLGTCYSQVHHIFHVSLCKPFHTGSDGYIHPTSAYIKDEQEWKVIGILQHKGPGAKRKYLIAYSGYGKSRAFWVPESELFNALDIIYNSKVSHGLN